MNFNKKITLLLCSVFTYSAFSVLTTGPIEITANNEKTYSVQFDFSFKEFQSDSERYTVNFSLPYKTGLYEYIIQTGLAVAQVKNNEDSQILYVPIETRKQKKNFSNYLVGTFSISKSLLADPAYCIFLVIYDQNAQNKIIIDIKTYQQR